MQDDLQQSISGVEDRSPRDLPPRYRGAEIASRIQRREWDFSKGVK
jgi:hypothetical protein